MHVIKVLYYENVRVVFQTKKKIKIQCEKQQQNYKISTKVPKKQEIM